MEIVWLELTDTPALWQDLGFVVTDDVCVIYGVEHRLIGPSSAGRGIIGWGVSGVDPSVSDIDGIPTTAVAGSPKRPISPEHPNGVFRIDHLVLKTSDTPRTAAAIEALGEERRGGRGTNHAGDAVDMTFFWAGETLLELAGPRTPSPTAEPARLSGLAFSSTDLDATVAYLGDRSTRPVDAVQAGRRIAALTKQAGSSVPTAFMTPHIKTRPHPA